MKSSYERPVDEFAKVKFSLLVECAEKVSNKDYSYAKEKLELFNENCKGFFNSILLSSNDSVENNMDKYFKEVLKLYKSGFYGNENTVDFFVKETLLDQFSLEYDTMLQTLGSACRLMQRVDAWVSDIFFVRHGEELIIKKSAIELISGIEKDGFNSSKMMFPAFISCAEKASKQDFTGAAKTLFSLELDCEEFLTSPWISTISDITNHLKVQFGAVEKFFKYEMYDNKCQTIENMVKHNLLNEFWFEFKCILKKLMHACELMLAMDVMGFHEFLDHLILNRIYVEDDIHPAPVPKFYLLLSNNS